MTAATNLKPIHRTRQSNLKRVLHEKFDDNISEAARAVDRSHTFMWQLIDGYRGIGEKSARHIEGKLDLVPGSLDTSKASRTAVLKTIELRLLSALDEKSKVLVPTLLVEGDAEKRFFATLVTDRDVEELHVGDQAIIDRSCAKVPLKSKVIYLVQPKGRTPCFLMASKEGGAMLLRATVDGSKVKYDEREVKVYGALRQIVREMGTQA